MTEDGILNRIVAAKRKRIAVAKESESLAHVASAADAAEPPLDFGAPLRSASRVAVIAEMKRRSPSGGELDPELDAADRAARYCESGAAAVSVLTEYDYFGGATSDLVDASAVARASGVPVLQKDFVFDDYQIYAARAAGASSVLLIIAILERRQYADLYDVAVGLGMEPLVEVFDARELDVAMTAAEPRIVGVNNRNLKTLRTSLGVFPKLARRIPAAVTKVAESGMRDADDVQRMADAGADAVLVGESLMRAGSDPSRLVRQMATARG